MESPWPAIVAALANRQRSFSTQSAIIPFLALMRVRGPAFRDAAELHLSNFFHVQAQILNDAGRLPPPPEGHEDLFGKMEIAIDPHQSLVAMADALSTIGELLAALSYDVLHNETGVPFLTSDNPVMYYEPNITDRMLPYTVRPPHGQVELLFQVTPRMVLRGRSRPARKDISHKRVGELRTVNRINRLTARFAYRTVFASWQGSARVIQENAAVSPVPKFNRMPTVGGGYYSIGQFVFAGRPEKPKW